MTKRPTAARGNAMKAAMLVPDHDEEPAIEAKPDRQEQPPNAAEKIDGRSLHATGRTHQFATRIKLETHQKMLEIVQREKAEGQPRFTLAELIEKAVDLYKRERWSR